MLEYEERIVSTEIEVYSKRKVPVPDELSDRKQQLEIKMQLLVLQVQTGKLTMESMLITFLHSNIITICQTYTINCYSSVHGSG